MDYLTKIAEALGISRSSVYRAIKHTKPMSADMRKTIIDYINNHYPEKLTRFNALNENIKSKHIVIIMPYKPEYFWKEAASGIDAAKECFDECNVELQYIFYSGKMSEEELITILDSIEVKTADALCVVPVDSEKIAKKINEISEKIPVAVFNESCHGATAFLNVISNGYEEGKAVGQMIKSACQNGSHIIMLLTENYPGNVIIDRMRGFTDTLVGTDENKTNYFIDKVYTECNDIYNYHTILPALMARKINECIEKVEANGGNVCAVYIPNGMLASLLIALRKLNRYDIFALGHEINNNALELFKSCMHGGYVRQDIYTQGYIAVTGLIKKLFFDETAYPKVYITQFESNSYFN